MGRTNKGPGNGQALEEIAQAGAAGGASLAAPETPGEPALADAGSAEAASDPSDSGTAPAAPAEPASGAAPSAPDSAQALDSAGDELGAEAYAARDDAQEAGAGDAAAASPVATEPQAEERLVQPAADAPEKPVAQQAAGKKEAPAAQPAADLAEAEPVAPATNAGDESPPLAASDGGEAAEAPPSAEIAEGTPAQPPAEGAEEAAAQPAEEAAAQPAADAPPQPSAAPSPEARGKTAAEEPPAPVEDQAPPPPAEPAAAAAAFETPDGKGAADIFTEMLRIQAEAARQMMQTFMPDAVEGMPGKQAIDDMGDALVRLNAMWQALPYRQRSAEFPTSMLADPLQWMGLMQTWLGSLGTFDAKAQHALWDEGIRLWENILSQYGLGSRGEETMQVEPQMPRVDRRFADPAWREQPVFALIHQTYLLFADRISEAVDRVDNLSDREKENLRFATRSILDAMSPANFPLMNPVVLERTLETKGQNLVTGMSRLMSDLERGQLTHTDESKFRIGENVACTPGKVVHETPLYQVIQYSPTTDQVLQTPLVIFPPWINRFYILDLNPKKSFVRWAVEQGLTVFMVSWRSADASLANIVWDDYIRAQIDVIDLARERLGVPAVHTIGYCVAGTTLAATLAVLARRGQGDKVASATFFTAQVDFEHAGELKLFIDDSKLELVRQASEGGYLDGRYMAAAFNLLRGSDLIWNYVVNHYLLGEDYPAFDLLYWNGDVTNLPARWHAAYLRDLYRDNKLVEPDVLAADGTPIDLSLVKTPCYVQAGREDHIAPPESVFKLPGHFRGPVRFLLAGSGHIAGVVNPPSANKYQYWINEEPVSSLEEYVAGAVEHKGSWWPDWIAWLEGQDAKRVPATGARQPGSEANPAIEDAPGRYVTMR